MLRFNNFFHLFFLSIVIQACHDNSKNYEKLERLASRVINPFLGSKGLFDPVEIKDTNQHQKHNKHEKLTPVSSNSSGGSTPETSGIS